MKKILVPCDFSEQAISAFRMAVDLAQQAEGEILLLHVVEIPVMHDTAIVPVVSFEEALLKELSVKAEKEFNALRIQFGSPTITISERVVFGGTARMISDVIHEEGIDLVVMGTRGASGLRELLVGSTTEKVVRNASCPVMAVKGYTDVKAIKNIVFPNSLELEQEDLMMKVKALQHFLQATLHVLWVNTPSNFTRDTITRERLNEFVNRFMLKNYTLNIFNDPYEEDGIIHFTKSINADMIAMGTHGRKGLLHIMSGSVAEDVVNHVGCPIWTYTINA